MILCYFHTDVRVTVVKNHLSSDPKFFDFASAAVVNPSSGHANMLMSASSDGTMWSNW